MRTDSLSCTVCLKPVEDSFSEWIIWNRKLDGVYIVHKGHCLEYLEQQLGKPILSWELDWITHPERYNDIMGNTKSAYVRIIDLLYTLVTYATDREIPGLLDLLNSLILFIESEGEHEVSPPLSPYQK